MAKWTLMCCSSSTTINFVPPPTYCTSSGLLTFDIWNLLTKPNFAYASSIFGILYVRLPIKSSWSTDNKSKEKTGKLFLDIYFPDCKRPHVTKKYVRSMNSATFRSYGSLKLVLHPTDFIVFDGFSLQFWTKENADIRTSFYLLNRLDFDVLLLSTH